MNRLDIFHRIKQRRYNLERKKKHYWKQNPKKCFVFFDAKSQGRKRWTNEWTNGEGRKERLETTEGELTSCINWPHQETRSLLTLWCSLLSLCCAVCGCAAVSRCLIARVLWAGLYIISDLISPRLHNEFKLCLFLTISSLSVPETESRALCVLIKHCTLEPAPDPDLLGVYTLNHSLYNKECCASQELVATLLIFLWVNSRGGVSRNCQSVHKSAFYNPDYTV